jgi:hypothetical protein
MDVRARRAATIDLPAYRYPPLALAAQVLAVVGLGVARAALDLMGKMAGTRGSITGAPVMADAPMCRSRWPRAKASGRPPAPGSSK